jgi:divalent metal cation (Fe/Co/Zn/Cd) transporter
LAAEQIRGILLDDPAVCAISEVRTVHFGPRKVLATISADFEDSLTTENVERAVSRLEARIKTRLPSVSSVFIESQSSE